MTEKMKTEKPQFALRPDAQAFDEIKIKIMPRFKESELSGSEWRTSAKIEFFRKGNLILTEHVGNIQTACGMLYAKYIEAVDNGKGYFAGNGIDCDQEGCINKATVFYKIKQDYCVGGGNCGQKKNIYTNAIRSFCAIHKHRGDQDIQDSDANYELIPNPNI